MRHRKQGRALSRNPSHRRAMLANMATSVLEKERVQTTTAKAKEVRRLVERLITFGKRNDLHARRQAVRVIRNRSVVAKLFGTLADRYADRAGGYTRIIHIGQRQGDAAEMSILELIDRERTIDVQTAEPKEEEQPKKTRRSSKEAEPASEAVTEEAAASEVVTEEAATSEAVTEEAAASEAVTEEAATSEVVTEEAAASEAVTEEAATSEAVTEEAAASEVVTEEAATSEAEPEVAAAKTKKSKKADDKKE